MAKKSKTEKVKKPVSKQHKEIDPVEIPAEEPSIEKFLKARKLQNQILEKMLDKLNQTNRKNKK